MAGASSWKIERAVGGGVGAFAREGGAPTPPPTAPRRPNPHRTKFGLPLKRGGCPLDWGRGQSHRPWGGGNAPKPDPEGGGRRALGGGGAGGAPHTRATTEPEKKSA